MSVLIKGMDLPKSCATCKLICQDTAYKISTFEQVITYFCKELDENNVIQNTLIKLPNCPLVEIPTLHGRLIDVDALQQKIIDTVNSGEPNEKFTARDVIQLIEYAPTIIEAEG
jgi:hypothetical protein